MSTYPHKLEKQLNMTWRKLEEDKIYLQKTLDENDTIRRDEGELFNKLAKTINANTNKNLISISTEIAELKQKMCGTQGNKKVTNIIQTETNATNKNNTQDSAGKECDKQAKGKSQDMIQRAHQSNQSNHVLESHQSKIIMTDVIDLNKNKEGSEKSHQLCKNNTRTFQSIHPQEPNVVERANTALQGSPQTQSIAKITIESINLKVPHLTPNDDIKLQLLTRIKADESMMIPFRRWELHELPALTQGSTIEIWSVKTCSALDSPRYVIVFFQTKKADNLHEDVTLFDNANIKSIRLALNSDYYPQERMLLDFSRDQYADAHFNYTEFNKSYHNCQEKRSLVNFAEFKSRPMFVIDCSRRHLGLKSSTVDINEEAILSNNVKKIFR
ncbi:unnamed protein product [Phaedon cochleariae]|uniref:Double jelly roll-like domain-containing protein n=1 Tax=Phaedon cochleariae TaxID=80249 RepID=A0A9N9X4K8_PHACE|nr:unnamed protein product [Phaedon cochleariae]